MVNTYSLLLILITFYLILVGKPTVSPTTPSLAEENNIKNNNEIQNEEIISLNVEKIEINNKHKTKEKKVKAQMEKKVKAPKEKKVKAPTEKKVNIANNNTIQEIQSPNSNNRETVVEVINNETVEVINNETPKEKKEKVPKEKKEKTPTITHMLEINSNNTEEIEIVVSTIIFEDTQYLMDDENNIYDYITNEKVGYYKDYVITFIPL